MDMDVPVRNQAPTPGDRSQLRIDQPPNGSAKVPLWQRVRSHRLVWGTLAVLMIAFSIAPMYNVARGAIFNKDYDLWQAVGRTVVAGGDVYPRTTNLFPFMYPPSCAAMLAPLSPLPRGAFVASLLLINAAAWVACILCSVYLATGRLKGNAPELYFWPSMAIVPFIHDTFLLGQPAMLLLALLLGAFVCLKRGRPIGAGALVAISAGIKAFPILAIGYFIYRRQWRATASTVITLMALMFVAPMAFRSPARVGEDFVLWSRGMLFKYDERTIAQRPERAYSFKNQSIQATVHRLARPVLANGEDDKVWRVNLISLDFRSTTLLMLAATGSLGLFYLWSSWRSPTGPPSSAVEQAIITLLILMVAPLSFNYSYAWLMYPFTLLAHLYNVSPRGSSARRLSVAAIAAPVGLLILSIPMPKNAQAYGNVFFSGLILLIAMGVVLRRGWYRWDAQTPSSSASVAQPHLAVGVDRADWVAEGAGI